jgi:hypothetical protein
VSTAERLEQLRDLPLVTAADRERYKRWEQEARAELAEVEPPSARIERAYLRAAMRRRGWVVLRGHYAAGDTPLTRDEWRDHWRSLPDYDGPPMRAPSGVRVSIGTGPSDLILFSALYPPKKKGELPRMVYTKVAITSPWTEIDPPLDDYGHPSAGGRGWCRGLAGVSE